MKKSVTIIMISILVATLVTIIALLTTFTIRLTTSRKATIEAYAQIDTNCVKIEYNTVLPQRFAAKNKEDEIVFSTPLNKASFDLIRAWLEKEKWTFEKANNSTWVGIRTAPTTKFDTRQYRKNLQPLARAN